MGVELKYPILFYPNPHVRPGFKGGDIQKSRKSVMPRIRYPEAAAENGISGRVFVQFIVDHLTGNREIIPVNFTLR